MAFLLPGAPCPASTTSAWRPPAISRGRRQQPRVVQHRARCADPQRRQRQQRPAPPARMCEPGSPSPDGADMTRRVDDNAALYRDLRARRVALYGADMVALQDGQFRDGFEDGRRPHPGAAADGAARIGSPPQASAAVLAGTASAVVACWIIAMYFLLNSEGLL